MTLSKRARHLVLLLLAAVPAVVGAPSLARLRLGELPSLIAGAPATIAEAPVEAGASVVAAATGRHLGFDTNIYPGDGAMRAWQDEGSPYEWVGYYLPAPCHKDDSWAGKRETLTSMGWGLAVIYVGQQTWDGIKGPSSRAVAAARRRGTLECHRSLLGAARGRADGDDAMARTVAEGFEEGTTIFLDVEYMDVVSPRMREYYRAWVARVLADGRFRPGVYVHTRNASRIHSDVRDVFASMGVDAEPAFWIASGRGFDTDAQPTDVGHRFADAWQGVLDVVQTWNGVTLPIDVNVAAVPAPSDHRYSGWTALESAGDVALGD
jgi:hypothetical protein